MVPSDEGATHSPPMKNRSAWRTGAVVALAAVICLLRSERSRCGTLLRAVAERQVLDAAVDDRGQTLDRSRHLERLQPRQQVTENRLELDPGDVRAHAEVLAEAEREMRVRAAIDSELERVVEHLLVAVRRREVQRNLLARVDRGPPHLAILGGGAREVADRADPAQDLLHRIREQLRTFSQLLPLAAVLGEGEQASADGVARGLVARLDEELAVRDELLCVQPGTVDLGLDQLADQVVARVAPTLRYQLIEVGMELPACALAGRARGLTGAPVLR